jgi:hypothetical protein
VVYRTKFDILELEVVRAPSPRHMARDNASSCIIDSAIENVITLGNENKIFALSLIRLVLRLGGTEILN